MTRAPQTRQSLLLELGKHSEEAWSEFLAVYESALVAFCRSMGLQEADARDATQEVLEALLQRLPSWQADAQAGSFRGWLFRVAHNVAVDAIAERSRAAASQGGSAAELVLAELAQPGPGEDERFQAELQRSLLEWGARQVRAEVRELTWRAFRMTAIEGVPAAEVARRLEVPVGTVYTAKCRVVARIRQRIAELSGEHPRPGSPGAPLTERD